MQRAMVLGMFVLGCGGTAVIDAGAGGTGGAGGTASTSSSGSSTSSSGTTTGVGGGTPDCTQLGNSLDEAIAAATACDPCIDIPDPCTYPADQTLTDACGCPIPINGLNEATRQNALSVYQQWAAAGCGPFECGTPCAVSTNPTCQPTGPGCVGVCGP
jgi:hypothetical protein